MDNNAMLRCNETFNSNSPKTPLLRNRSEVGEDEVMSAANNDNNRFAGQQGLSNSSLLQQFCNAYRDRAILGDSRVLKNLISLERHYVPKAGKK